MEIFKTLTGENTPTTPDEEKKEGGKLEEEFDEICYLAVQANFFSTYYKANIASNRTTPHPTVFMATNSLNTTSIDSSIPATLMNKIDLFEFVYARPALFALLYPKLELYRIDYEAGKNITERLFLIPHEANELYNDFNNVNTKVAGVGIKSANWTLAGSNPAAAEKLIDFSLDIELANAYEFCPGSLDLIIENYIKSKGFPFNETDTKNTTINFLSLILHPQGKRNEYDGRFYRIKAKVGWQRIDAKMLVDIGYDSPTADALSAALSTQSMTLILNLISHSFEIAEQGSISLNIKYQASLEQATDSNIFDLFYRHSLQKEKYSSSTSTISQLKNTKQALLDSVNDECLNLTEEEKKLVKDKVLVDVDKQTQEQIEQQENTLKDLEIEAKQSLMSYLSNNKPIVDNSFYVAGAVVGAIAAPLAASVGGVSGVVALGSVSAGGATVGAIGSATAGSTLGDPTSGNTLSIYTISVSEKQVEEYIKYIKEINSGNKSASLSAPTASQVTNKVTIDDAVDISQQQSSIDSQTNGTFDSIISKTGEKLLSLVEGVAKLSDFDVLDNERAISFIYLYDLIVAFYNVLVDHINKEYNTSDQIKQQELLKELNRFKIVLGQFQDRDTGKVVNIGEIPVHLQTFNEWYTNNIAKTNRVNYTFRDFIYSMVNDIVAKSLGASCVTAGDLEKKISLGFSTYSHNHGFQQEPCFSTVEQTGYIDFGIPNTKSRYKLNIIPTSQDTSTADSTNYLYVYAKQLPCELKGNPIEDVEKGIYHFYIGQTEGIQKSIKFKRIDQPYLKEARATKEDSFVLGQLREVYNVDVVTVGNTIFHPGMIIYIHPPLELGLANDTNSFSYLLGLGGYYSIIKVESTLKLEGFETTLQCVYLTSPNCIKQCKRFEEQTKQERLSQEIVQLEVLKALTNSIRISARDLEQIQNDPRLRTFDKQKLDLIANYKREIELYNKLAKGQTVSTTPTVSVSSGNLPPFKLEDSRVKLDDLITFIPATQEVFQSLPQAQSLIDSQLEIKRKELEVARTNAQ